MLAAKRQNRKIVAVSCYDYTTDKVISQTGVQMIKIEASGAYLDVIKAVSDAGMAVMAHIGIRPQSISKIGRFKRAILENLPSQKKLGFFQIFPNFS